MPLRRSRLDELRPLLPEALDNLEHYYDIELTYTSNAIEGNTLSPVETTLVIEKGITISGKPLKDHLEALDHYDAIRYVRELARQGSAADGKRRAQSASTGDAALLAGDRGPVRRPSPLCSHRDGPPQLSVTG